MLRIIAGKNRGRKIEQPPLEVTRPTTDKIREALFSSIHMDLPGAVILDLFSGSGVFSLEAISRGAMKSIAVENNQKAIKVIKFNIHELKEKNIEVIKRDVVDYLSSKSGTKFDFIFMDPPYENKDLYNESLQHIKNNGLLKNQGLIICEIDNPRSIKIPEDMLIQKDKKYGSTHILYIANNI